MIEILLNTKVDAIHSLAVDILFNECDKLSRPQNGTSIDYKVLSD